MSQAEFDWRAWRRDARRSLLSARRALPGGDLQARNDAIDATLRDGFAAFADLDVAFCWPMASEPEPRHAIRRWRDAGSRAALPVVMGARRPMIFRQWYPGVTLREGVYDIPYPTDSPEVVPSAVLMPVVGFDTAGYRLGYGGGYFDLTLSAMAPRPIAVGLGYEVAAIRTIHPQPHDVPMDFVVTEAGIRRVGPDGLEHVDAATADEAVRELRAERFEAG